MADHGLLTAAQLAEATMREITGATGLSNAVLIVEEDQEGMGRPFVAFHGNTTAAAHLVRAFIEVVGSMGRPTDCIACMENYDALMRARGALDAIVGQC